ECPRLLAAPEEDAHEVALLVREGDELAHARAQLALEAVARARRGLGEARAQPAQRVEGDLPEQRLLVREVQVEGAGRHARAARDARRGGGVQALAREQRGGGGDQAAARFGAMAGGGAAAG